MFSDKVCHYVKAERRPWTINSNGRHCPYPSGSAYTQKYTAKRGRENLYMASLDSNNCDYLGQMNTVIISEELTSKIGEMLKNADLTNLKSDMSTDPTAIESHFKRNFLKTTNQTIGEKISQTPIALMRDVQLDESIYNEFMELQQSETYREADSIRKRLPSYPIKEEIIQMVETNQITVITGQTGSGKTTQVPQFILDDYILKKKGSLCNILCTQLRRISAVSIAERVAYERADKIGGSVGYRIRLESCRPRDRGSIEYCTLGIVIKAMDTDPCLSAVSHLVMDEVHERDMMTDFMFGLIKKILRLRPDLKIILMGATLNVDILTQFFDNCPHIEIPGFNYPVQEYFLEDVLECTGFRNFDQENRYQTKQRDNSFYSIVVPYVTERCGHLSSEIKNALMNPMSEEICLSLICELILYICQSSDSGAILTFVTGYNEIASLYLMLSNSSHFPSQRYKICPLHSTLSPDEQKKVFDRPPFGVRKIVIATNIAETSITIDDVVYVIDCGKIKLSQHDVRTNTQTLLPHWISLANSDQRKGRAGRVQPGVCYHLFTRGRYKSLKIYQTPEILRKRLDDIILSAKMLQLGKIAEFFEYLLDTPDMESIKSSIQLLQRLDALDKNENLTPLGYHIAKLPLAPQLGKMILYGAIFSCVDPMLSIAASLDFKDPFQVLVGRNNLSYDRKLELSNELKSDHILFHQVLMEYETKETSYRAEFCKRYFIAPETCLFLLGLRRQFMSCLFEQNLVSETDPHTDSCNKNSDNIALVKALVGAALYPNVLNLPSLGKPSLWTPSNPTNTHQFHPKSVLVVERNFNAVFVAYNSIMKTQESFVHDGTLIYTLPIILFGDNFELETPNLLSLSKTLKFKCTELTGKVLYNLRVIFKCFLDYVVTHPSPVSWEGDRNPENYILEVMKKLMVCESRDDRELAGFDNA